MKKLQKYPLLICLIISAVIIVSSLFVIGFCGLKFDATIVGGSQIEIVLADDADTQEYSNSVRVVCKQTGLSLYYSFVEEKFTAGEENGSYTRRVMVLTFAETDISDKLQTEFREEIAEKLGVKIDSISEFKTVTTMVESTNIWLVILSIAIVIVCVFVFAWFRYDIVAAIAFLVAYLHSIILYFAVSGITRTPISITSLAVMVLLTFIMGAVLVHMFEEYRKISRLYIDDKKSTTERMMGAQRKSLLPYTILAIVVAVIALLLSLSPVYMVRLTALSMFIALAVIVYTVTLVTPSVYCYFADVRKDIVAAKLSRNDTKNKAIKKKIATSAKKQTSSAKKSTKSASKAETADNSASATKAARKTSTAKTRNTTKKEN